MNITVVLMLVSLIANNHTWCMYGTCTDGSLRYNCMDFSHDAVLLLRENNITSYAMCGWYNHGFHYWIAVDLTLNPKTDWFWAYENPNLIQIEPQSAQIIYPDELFYLRGRRCITRGLLS